MKRPGCFPRRHAWRYRDGPGTVGQEDVIRTCERCGVEEELADPTLLNWLLGKYWRVGHGPERTWLPLRKEAP